MDECSLSVCEKCCVGLKKRSPEVWGMKVRKERVNNEMSAVRVMRTRRRVE